MDEVEVSVVIVIVAAAATAAEIIPDVFVSSFGDSCRVGGVSSPDLFERGRSNNDQDPVEDVSSGSNRR